MLLSGSKQKQELKGWSGLFPNAAAAAASAADVSGTKAISACRDSELYL